MSFRSHRLLWPALFLACGGKPAASPPDAASSLGASAAEKEDAAQSFQAPSFGRMRTDLAPQPWPREQLQPRELVAQEGASCTLSEKRVEYKRLHLQPSVDGAAYVVLSKPAALQVALPLGDAQVAQVSAELGPVRLEGYVQTAEIPLHPTKPWLLPGVMALLPSSKLAFVRGSADKIAFLLREYNCGETCEKLGQAALVREQSCAFFALSPRTFDGYSVLPRALASDMIAPGLSFAMAPQYVSAGPLLSTTTIYRFRNGVKLLARQGKYAQIAAEQQGAILLAWVEAKELASWRKIKPKRKPQRHGSSMGSSLGGSSMGAFALDDDEDDDDGYDGDPNEFEDEDEVAGLLDDEEEELPELGDEVASWSRQSCQRELVLWLEQGPFRYRIGTLKSGHFAHFAPAETGFSEVAFPDAGVLPLPHNRLVVSDAERQAACKP